MAIGTISTPASWLNGTVAPASWFQNVQDNINGWIAGTGSSLVSLALNTNASGTSVPTTTVAKGTLFADSAVLAWGNITWTGAAYTIARAFNVASINKSATGTVQINLNVSYSGASALCSPQQLAGYGNCDLTGASQVTCYLKNTSATLTDQSFFFIVFGA